MSEKTKKILNIVSTVFVVIVVIIALLLVGARIFGIKVYTVLSGSMEPSISVGSIIYVKPCDITEIKVNDAISFVLSDEKTVATHRVTEIVPDASGKPEFFKTKGDANTTADADPVYYKNVIGKYVFSIPLLGYVSNFIQNPPGMYIAIAVGVLLLILVFLPDLLGKKNKKSEQTEKNEHLGENPAAAEVPEQQTTLEALAQSENDDGGEAGDGDGD